MYEQDLIKLKIDRNASLSAPRRRWICYLFTVVILIAIIGICTKLVGPRPVETARVTSAYPSQNYTLLNAAGYVVPQRKAAVSSKAQGRLEWLGVLEGTHVRQNEIIAHIESRDVEAVAAQARAQVQVAEANLQLQQAELRDAEVNLRRSRELLGPKAISKQQYDTDLMRYNKALASISNAQALVLSSRANARAAELSVEQTAIRAPFDGMVLVKHANVGDNITPFSAASDSKGAVVTIADMETLEVEADVAESSITKIAIDQACEIQLDALPDLRIRGRVSRIVPTVDRSKAAVVVKVRFVDRDQRVLPDMGAKIAFLSKPAPPEDARPVTAVQPAAIVERDGGSVVYVIHDGRLKQVPVTKGAKIGELVAVQGVSPGETVVLAPADELADGSKVTVTRK